MAAELRLGVSFDLVYFRQQLQKLSQIAASEFTGVVRLTIDKRNFQRQFNELSRDLRINVNDSQLDAARTRLTKLNKGLATFRRASAQDIVVKVRYEQEGALPGGAARGTFRQRLETLDKTQLAKLYEAAGAAGIQGFKDGIQNNKARLVTALNQMGEDTVAGLLNGLKSEDPALKAAAKSLGESLIKSTKAILGIASPSREFKKIGEDVGEGFENGLETGFEKASRVGVQQIRELMRDLQREAQTGVTKLQAIAMAAMAGVVALPGGQQQRNRLRQTGAGINAAMAGPVVGNIQARQGAVRQQRTSAAATTPSFMAALPLMLGMGQNELTARLTGLYGQQYRAPRMGSGVPDQRAISRLITLLSSATSAVGAGRAPMESIARGGLRNPGLASSGYIGRAAVSPAFVNYAPGMPAAYGAGFAGAASGSFGMGRQPVQGPALPTRGIFAAPPAPGFGSIGRFPTAGMLYPSRPIGGAGVPAGGGSFVPPGGPPGGPPSGPPSGPSGFGSSGGFGRAAGQIGQFNSQMQQAMRYFQTARIPLTGAIGELGDEFGNAIKQVLLFGTAYKGLAFITNLPQQAFDAAKGLQTFENQLKAVTSETGTFEQSFQFIDNLATRFNVPLESARQGFVKLYASMQPAGFNQQQIESLFTGVSQATAAFGLSADKVDRVNYAFAQMASKGQIMSEELKGQLGDVLPGALALFADAAQMSIPEFSQAMEDGAFKGKAMMDVLNNVATLMGSRFGPAAQNASKTLQGALNGINNDLKRMYEAFNPIVSQLAQTFGPQISSLIKDFTDVIKVFSSTFVTAGEGVDALSPRARAIYDTIQQLIPAFRSAAEAVVQLGTFLGSLVPVAVQVGSVLLQIASSNVGRAFIALSISVSLLQTAFVSLTATGIVPAIRAIYQFLAANLATQMRGAQLAVFGLTKAFMGLQAAAVTSRIAVIALRLALTGLVVGGILLAIEAVGTALFSIGTKARQSGAEVRQLRADLDQLAGAGDTIAIGTKLEQAKAAEKAAAKRYQTALEQAKGADELMKIDPAAARSLGASANEALKNYQDAMQKRIDAQKALQNAEKVRLRQAQPATAQPTLVPITPSPESEKKKKGKEKKERESQVPQLQERLNLTRQILDLDRQILEARLGGNDLEVNRLEFMREQAEIQSEMRMVQLEDIPAREKALKIEELRIKEQMAFEKSQAGIRQLVLEDLKKQSDALEEIRKESTQELSNTKRYHELLARGVNPALARATVEVENKFAKVRQEFDLKTKQIELEIKELEGLKERTKEEQKRLDLLKEQLKLRGYAIEGMPGLQEEEQRRQEQLLAPKPDFVIAAEAYDEAKKQLEEITNSVNMLINAAKGIGDAFAQSFSAVITGSMSAKEALGQFFGNVGKMFADMAAKMIAQWMVMKAIGLIQSFFPGGATTAPAQAVQPQGMVFAANGGVMQGGWAPITPFAMGGMVTGPTLGLVGEGRFNEAVVPLPDGKSIPVDLGGGTGNDISTNIVVNVNNGQAQSNVSGSGGNQLAKQLDAAVKEVILRETRPGGIIYSSR